MNPEDELNKFLRSHRVVTVHREFVAAAENSFWSFVVEYLEGTSPSSKQASGGAGKKRVDYKEVLSPEDFAVFAKLREWRKHKNSQYLITSNTKDFHFGRLKSHPFKVVTPGEFYYLWRCDHE